MQVPLGNNGELIPLPNQPADAIDYVLYDETGRPYDVDPLSAKGHRVDHVANLHVPGGLLRVIDGNLLSIGPAGAGEGEAAHADFDSELLEASVVFQLKESEDGTTWESVAGVRIDVPGTTVSEWTPFEFGYGTDGGVGSITTQSVIDRSAPFVERYIEEYQKRPWGGLDDDDYFTNEDHVSTQLESQEFYLGDLDEVPGPESMMFGNGFGDGAFPMTRGLDSEGGLVSIMVWHLGYPWRLAVPDGTPPPDVTEMENTLIQCIAQSIPILEDGYCAEDPSRR